MATDIKLHVRTEDMTHDDLMGLGVIGGPFGQLAQDPDLERQRALLSEAPRYDVGRSSDEFPSRVSDIVDGPATIDETLIELIKTAAIQADIEHAELEDLLDFLEEHKGEEVFTQGW